MSSFSVFFSCFFLFLAFCIVAWRVKSSFDIRRARERHAVELLNMAQRPFASHTVQFANGNTTLTAAAAAPSSNRESRYRTVFEGKSKKKLMVHHPEEAMNLLQNQQQSNELISISPLAIEPLAVGGGQAAVATILIQMPQNQSLCFGCVLTPHTQSHTD